MSLFSMIKPTYFSSRNVCICNKTLHLTARYSFDSELKWSMQSLMALCGVTSCGPGCICIQTQAAGKSHNTPQMGPPRNSSNSLDRLGIPFWWLHIQKQFRVSKRFLQRSQRLCLSLLLLPSVCSLKATSRKTITLYAEHRKSKGPQSNTL